ncbi:MAG: HTTM domain-containing protein [Deltaproteobacteria bacterium]
MNALERHGFAPVSARRVFVLVRGVLIITAFDAFRLAAGALQSRRLDADLAIAHFELLDRLQPTPTAELRAGVFLAVGLFSALAVVRPTRWLLVPVALLQTWSWSMTIHDNFQHHYFVSILLWSLVSMPRVAVGPAGSRWPRGDVVAPGFSFVAASVGLTYFFTAVAKVSPAWVRGDVVAHLTMHLAPYWSSSLNPWVACLTIFFELLVAAAYVFAPRVRWRVIALATVSFHVCAELVFGLAIGAFSIYMVALAFVFLDPWRVAPGSKGRRAEPVEQGHEESLFALARARPRG